MPSLARRTVAAALEHWSSPSSVPRGTVTFISMIELPIVTPKLTMGFESVLVNLPDPVISPVYINHTPRSFELGAAKAVIKQVLVYKQVLVACMHTCRFTHSHDLHEIGLICSNYSIELEAV